MRSRRRGMGYGQILGVLLLMLSSETFAQEVPSVPDFPGSRPIPIEPVTVYSISSILE